MKILPLIFAPDPLLKQVSQPVVKIDKELQQFMQDMLTTMYNEGGVGLAAVQVGVLKRIVVADTDYELDDCCHSGSCSTSHPKNSNPRFFINPEIIEESKNKSSYLEGCLSFPEARSKVVRPSKVKVKYLDYNGVEKIEEMDNLLATCIQHEIDHLNGITFVDHISKLKRDIILNKVKKLTKR